MHYDPKEITPGKYGYRCRHCSNIAFAFTGDARPAPGTHLEDCTASQRGMYASVRRSKHICQHCAAPVTAISGMLDMDCVVDIDDYAAALQKRLNSAHSRHGSSRNIHGVVVDRDYMGCGLTAADQVGSAVDVAEEDVTPPKKVEKPKKGGRKSAEDVGSALGEA